MRLYLALLLLTLPLSAEVRLPNMFSDHAVLQRDAPIRIFGFATPGEHVTIHFHDQDAQAVTDKFGWWLTSLTPEKAGGPYTLTVTGDTKEQPLVRTDILIGDVWFASGQSNMEMPLKGFSARLPVADSAKEIAAATHPQVRLLQQKRTVSSFPLFDSTSPWTLCTPETAAPFSAVGYFFGREISEREHVPVGVIDSSWGGMATQAFTSLSGLVRGNMLDAFTDSQLSAESEARNTLLHEQVALDKAAKNPSAEQKPPAPILNWWTPGALYNGMIAPFTHYSIKGVIWYQGEADRGPTRNFYFVRGFPNMINDWRSQWKQGDFPFLFIQLPSFDVDNDHWPTVRDGQRRALSLVNTAMAVTLDTGEAKSIHPADKRKVAERLILAAQQNVYGEKIEGTSPTFVRAAPEGSAMRIWFTHASGLTTHGPADKGFEVAGEDHIFHPANAKIDGETITVSSTDVPSPHYVRYGWQGFVTSFIYNTANLPLGTFTSEETASTSPTTKN